MFCKKCGEKLAAGDSFCKSCGTIAGSKFQKISSPLYRTEKVIKEGQCNRVKKRKKDQQGKALLTTHQFVYFKLGIFRTFAMIFMGNLITQDIYIPLTDIQSIKNGCSGSVKTIVIYTKSGEKYDFYFTKRDEWKTAIQNAVIAIKQL